MKSLIKYMGKTDSTMLTMIIFPSIDKGITEEHGSLLAILWIRGK
jgi:hypothetical protein